LQSKYKNNLNFQPALFLLFPLTQVRFSRQLISFIKPNMT